MTEAIAAKVLQGMRVLELGSGRAGGMATMVMADFGADVVKIEPPGGDRFRDQASAPFWLRGKRSAVVDLEQASGRECLQQLAASADVVLVSGPPNRARRFGADWETLSSANPDLVHCSITGWGTRGPYANVPGYEGLVAALSGRMQIFKGQALREGPVFSALPVATHAASQGALQGILAALFARARGGGGQQVETSLLRALLPYDLVDLLAHQLQRRNVGMVPDLRAVGGGMPTLNYHPVMTSDGRWIQLGNILEHLLFAFLDATNLLGEMLIEERFQSPPAQWDPEAVEVARDLILTRMQERTADEWMETFRSNGNVVAEPFLTAQQALEHPDLVGNGDVISRDDPELGPMLQLGVLANLSETPGTPGGPAPKVGEHTEEVLAELARPRPSSRKMAPASPRLPGRPLEGVTVLEFATIIAAPLATTMLADLGARVIKVESLEGDSYRFLLPLGILAVKTNAGKESICVDLKSEKGSELVRELVAKADILVHNFRMGVPERLGIGQAEMRSLFPKLIWVAVTGYGANAPGAARPCTHPVAGASMGGVCLQAGEGMPPGECATLAEVRDASRRLGRANEANPDPNTSVTVASAILLALWARERLGTGQAVHVNMLAANAYANADDMLRYAGKPDRPTVAPGLYGLGASYRLYAARTGWVFLAIGNAREWESFAKACSSHPVFSDARFESAVSRRDHDEALGEALEDLFSERDAVDWQELLLPLGVGCVQADRSVGEFLLDDPHAIAEELAPETEHLRFGRTRRWGPIVTCNGGPDALGPGALAGDHTDELLRELGRGDEEIAELRDQRVVGSEAV
jgi:crotonobetainyl-CoA:carnitine CoA-transferase CaiB-like acyl-CoA transferase